MQTPVELTDIVLEDPAFEQKIARGSELYSQVCMDFFKKNREQLDRIRQLVESKYPEIHVVVFGAKKVLAVSEKYSAEMDMDEQEAGHPIYMLCCNENFETDGGEY